MAGRFRSSQSEVSNNAEVFSLVDRFDKIVPTAELGIGLCYQTSWMARSVGYEFHNWFGVVEGFDPVDDAHRGKLARRNGDLGFDGVFFRAELTF